LFEQLFGSPWGCPAKLGHPMNKNNQRSSQKVSVKEI
jgi:hypothetical protein